MNGARQRRWKGRTTAAATLALLVAVLTACGGGDDDLTPAQALDKLAGRPLSEQERSERLAVADLLCGFDARVLIHIWGRLDPGQLEFQDWIFGEYCPDRMQVYVDIRPTTGTAPTPTIDRDSTIITAPAEPDDLHPELLGSILADIDTDTDTDTDTDIATATDTDADADTDTDTEGTLRSGTGRPPR